MNSIRSLFKKFGVKTLKIFTAALVIYYLLISLDMQSAYNSLRDAELLLILISFSLLPVNIFLQFLKWKISCSYFFGLDDKEKIIKSLFAGFSAAVFTPGRVGEYFGRAVDLKGYRIAEITAAVFYDKLFTLTWVIFVGIWGLYILYHEAFLPVVITLTILAVVIITILNLRGLLGEYLGRILFVKSFIENIKIIRTPDKLYSTKMMFASFFFYSCYLFQFILLISAFTGKADYIAYLYAAGSIMFVKTMVPNFISGEIGIRESAAVFIMARLGENTAAGFNASVLLFIINIAIPSVLGLFPLLRKYK